MENSINKLLSDLEKLSVEFDTLNDNQKEHLYPLLQETLTAFKNTNNLHEEEFLKPLVILSEEVINIRRSDNSGFGKSLSIPCYDLFLPFKARKLEDVELVICPYEIQGIKNMKVDGILQKIQNSYPKEKINGSDQKENDNLSA